MLCFSFSFPLAKHENSHADVQIQCSVFWLPIISSNHSAHQKKQEHTLFADSITEANSVFKRHWLSYCATLTNELKVMSLLSDSNL